MRSEQTHNSCNTNISLQYPQGARLGLVFIQSLIGLPAVIGGWALVSDPNGANLNWTTAILRDSPFKDFSIPGLVLLLGVGLATLIGALLTWFEHHLAGTFAVLLAVFLMLFIALEIWWIGFMIWLQPFYFVVGLFEFGLGLAMHQRVPSVRSIP